MERPRLGIFGGTFDPPHHGHLIVAGEARDALRLDRLLLVPAANPPHKAAGQGATADQRVRMLRAVIREDSRFEIDDLEMRRSGASFTVDTLRELRKREPGAELVFLLGIDQFRKLDSWREPGEIAALATLAVLSRGGETADPEGPYEGLNVPVSRIDISATEIRRRVAAGLSIRYYVPEGVREIIERESIYRV